MAFSESPRFPAEISYGASGGATFKTLISANDGGYEQRDSRWQYPLHVYDVAQGAKTQTDIDTLKSFFMNKSGMLTGFRFKDWSDYKVVVAESSLVLITGTLKTHQLGKTYTSGASSILRTIKKVVDGSHSVYLDGSAVTEGMAGGQYTVDTATGIVTIMPTKDGIATNVSNANPAVVSDPNHNLTNGDEIVFTQITGMTELRDVTVTVTVIDANSFSIGVNSTGYGTYSGGGLWEKYVQSSEVLTAAFEFDVPVRFGSDSMSVFINDKDILSWSQIPLVELR